MRQVVIDTETTGLSTEAGDRIIEIGCLELLNRRLTGSSLHFYLNPERPVEPGAVAIHGITNEFLADKPLFHHIVDELMAYLQDSQLIIHNAPFDVSFLNHEIHLTRRALPLIEEHCTILDTLVMARQKHPGQHNSLDALCRRYRVDNSNRKFHGALLDAELLAQVYLLMTGGQTHLFEKSESVISNAKHTTLSKTVSTHRSRLPIIKATPEELEVHEAFLKTLETED